MLEAMGSTHWSRLMKTWTSMALLIACLQGCATQLTPGPASAPEDAGPRRQQERHVDLPRTPVFLRVVERHPLAGGTRHAHRLLFARPSAVLLLAIGFCSPLPSVYRRFFSTPLVTSYSLTG